MPAESRMGRTCRPFFEGWQGVVLIATTYVYFLIFAQFGFLKRLAELGITEVAAPGHHGRDGHRRRRHEPACSALPACGTVPVAACRPALSVARSARSGRCFRSISYSAIGVALVDRSFSRPAHGDAGCQSSPVDRDPSAASQSRPRHRHRIFPLQFSAAVYGESALDRLDFGGCCLVALIVANRSRLVYYAVDAAEPIASEGLCRSRWYSRGSRRWCGSIRRPFTSFRIPRYSKPEHGRAMCICGEPVHS